ncbi:unnamed protein product, partial [Effrenium voratum]
MSQWPAMAAVALLLLCSAAAERASLELRHGDGQHSASLELDADPCPADPKAVRALQALGLRGSGSVCQWQGVNCRDCQVLGVKISSPKLKGSIEELKYFSGLKVLNLKGQVSGDVGALQNLTELTELSLEGSQVYGDVAHLRSLRQLRYVKLTDSRVYGNLQVFQGMEGLRELLLGLTRVRGHLQALAGCRNMTLLVLRRLQGVTGTMKSCENMTQLKILFLSGTQVEGELQAVGELRRLFLSETKVHGNLSALRATRGFSALETLDLAGTGVFGDLVALKNHFNLVRAYLSDTLVSGDFAVLHKGKQKNVCRLQELTLKGTNVFGDLKDLPGYAQLVRLDLQGTSVTGRLSSALKGCCQKLGQLVLSDSRVTLLPTPEELAVLRQASNLELFSRRAAAGCRAGYRLPEGYSTDRSATLLPALVTLEVSRSPLLGPVEHLLLPLAGSPNVARLVASGCGLFGTLPNLQALDSVTVDDRMYARWVSFISKSLQLLDLSENQITRVEGVPAHTLVSLASNGALSIHPGLLAKALEERVEVKLQGTALLNQSEVLQMVGRGELNMTEDFRMTDINRGFTCHGLDSVLLQVSPELFLPQALCGCSPGWYGSGKDCRRCPAGTYNKHFNRSFCKPCPGEQKSPVGAASVRMCLCSIGEIYDQNAWNGTNTSKRDYACGCPDAQALHAGACVGCPELHLDCIGFGTLAVNAPATAGWARLAAGVQTFRCLAPEERCVPENDGCAAGYGGPLCVTCADGYRSTQRGLCKPCADFGRWTAPSATSASVVVGILAAAAVASFVVWRRRRATLDGSAASSAEAAPSARDAALALLVVEGPFLLQLCQLWVVVAALAGSRHLQETKEEEAADRSFAAAFPEQPYMKWLQLSAIGLQDALSLECTYGASARSAAAVAAPLIPLALLALCGAVELFARSSGISLALKALTLFFIGGASGCARLLSCQDTDGGGEPLGGHAFRTAFPHLKCSDPSWVDGLGWLCAIAYGGLIPICLLALMMKQHVALQSSRKVTAFVSEYDDKLLVRVHEFRAAVGTEKE